MAPTAAAPPSTRAQGTTNTGQGARRINWLAMVGSLSSTAASRLATTITSAPQLVSHVTDHKGRIAPALHHLTGDASLLKPLLRRSQQLGHGSFRCHGGIAGINHRHQHQTAVMGLDQLQCPGDGFGSLLAAINGEENCGEHGDRPAWSAPELVLGGVHRLASPLNGDPPLAKRSIASLSSTDLSGKSVLVRVDFNVPLDDHGVITDDTRIRAALPTIRDLLGKGAKVILAAHFGRPKGQVVDDLRLTPVADRLGKLLGQPVAKTDSCIGPEAAAQAAALQPGQALLLENVRFFKEEEENDPAFAGQLASLAQVYVNDAFGAAHRAHASTAGVTAHLSPCVSGLLMEKELQYLQGAIEQPQRPLAAIVGGSKVSSKIGVLASLMEKCDKVLIGGGMIFTFYKARGLPVGKSLVEDDKLELARELEATARARGVELLLPTDVVAADRFAADANHRTVPVDGIPEGWMGLDIGPDSVAAFQKALAECRSVIWNGPMGVFEFDAFAAGTNRIAMVLAELASAGATTIIGGGDSVAAVEKAGVAGRMSHISTGGGASLELLEGKVLPGVAALDDLA